MSDEQRAPQFDELNDETDFLNRELGKHHTTIDLVLSVYSFLNLTVMQTYTGHKALRDVQVRQSALTQLLPEHLARLNHERLAQVAPEDPGETVE